MSQGTIRAVAKFFEINPAKLMDRDRSLEVVLARNILCLILRDRDKRSYTVIGRTLSGRDHSTIIHSVEQARISVAEYPYIAAFVAKEMALDPIALSNRDAAAFDRPHIRPSEPVPPPPRVRVRNEEYLSCPDARKRIHGSFALTRALQAAMAQKIA